MFPTPNHTDALVLYIEVFPKFNSMKSTNLSKVLQIIKNVLLVTIEYYSTTEKKCSLFVPYLVDNRGTLFP